MASTSVVLLTKGLLLFFICSVATWYLMTPYLIQPHPRFKEDMYNLVNRDERASSGNKTLVENWTKWRLYIGNEQINQTIYAQHKQPIEGKNSRAVFEWRAEYLTSITDKFGQVAVAQTLPWYSKYGLYNHFYVQTNHSTVKFVPNFMFGLPNSIVEAMYGSADKIPIKGMITSSGSMDRVIIQCYMNLVLVAIVFLIYIQNPIKRTKQD